MTTTLLRTVITRWDAASAFDYLLDFEHAVEWDSGTVRCTRTAGDGGLGTTYLNVSKFLGRETELDYKVEKLVPGKQFVITGGNKTVVSKDTVTVTPRGDGAEVEYKAEMTFSGVAGVIAPLLSPFLKKLADDTEAQLLQTLDARAGRA
jgi:Polyketide cyclase / dehydrase and lipid transport